MQAETPTSEGSSLPSRGPRHRHGGGRTRRGAAGPIIALIVASVAWLPPAAHADDVLSQYQGTLVGDPAATVSLTVKRLSGGRKAVVFEADNIQRTCDNGTVERVSFGMRTLRLRHHGYFRSIEYQNNDIYQTFYEVKGRIRPGGLAEGFILELSDSIGNPSPPSIPDCSTQGMLSWTATRQG